MKRRCSFLVAFLLVAAVTAVPLTAYAQDKNDVKGQDQLNGSMGSFGTTYTLKNKFNITILSAHYTLDPVEGYSETIADAMNKVLVMDLALKNADSVDEFLNLDGQFTFIDDKGQSYTGGELSLSSKGSAPLDITLKPGQGLGQAALNDPFRYAIKIPAKARITKLIVNSGRLNTSEDVIRFLLVEPPKDASSAVKNFIAPLPTEVRDPSDSFGSVQLDEGKAAMNQTVTSGGFQLKVTDLSSPAGAVYGGNPPDDGKRYLVATVSAKWLMEKEGSVSDLFNSEFFELTDVDNERYKSFGFRKMNADEDPDRTFKQGDEYSVRVFFVVPTAAKLKHLSFASATGPKWGFDLP